MLCYCEFLLIISNFSIVDPAVYGLLYVAGLIPGIDNFTGPVGMLYAGYWDNSENILAYSLASAIYGAGAMYFKAGGEVFGAVAKLDDAGNLSYSVRSMNGEVTENELQLSSSYIRQKDITKGALAEIQKWQNYEHIKSLILAKSGVLECVESLAKYSNIRKYLGNSRVKQYLNNQELFDFETIYSGISGKLWSGI